MKLPRLTLSSKDASAADGATGVDVDGAPAGSAMEGTSSGPGASSPSAARTSFAAAKRHDEPVIGGIPRVSLLPPELATAAKVRATGRWLVLLIVGVLLITGTGVVATTLESTEAQTQLADAQATTRTLLKEQGKYSAASDVQELLATVKDARTYGASTEIDWSTYLQSITAPMPPGLVMLDATATAGAPWEGATATSGPLRATRMATVALRVQSLTESEISEWVRTLEDLPGFADASIDGWSHDETGFIASVTLNISADALSGRYATENGN